VNGVLSTGSRLLLAAAFGTAAIFVWIQREAYRGVEALVAGWTSAWATGSHDYVNTERSTYFINVGTPDIFGIVVTPECSSAIVTAVILAVSFFLLGMRRLPMARVLGAAALAVGLFVLINVLRLTFITFSSDRWGLDDGYHFSHVWAGTVITTFGGALTVAAFLFVLSGHRLHRRPEVQR
jgi:exosortase/archaeosortase family protein